MKAVLFALIFLMSLNLNAQVSVTINETTTYQTITGFGGFGAKKAFWDTAPYYDTKFLSETIDNLGVTFFRTQIYWDGEPANDNSDPLVADASKFNFGPTSDNGKQFQFIKDLSAKGAKLLATVWSPPTWMKLYDDPARIPEQCYNCTTCAPGSEGRKMCGGRLNPDYYGEYAEYLVMYVKTLKEKTGVDLYGISIQNEPYFANPFESNVMLPEEYAAVLKVVGARFKQEGLPTRFFGPEHMAEWSWGWQQKYVQNILADNDAKQYLDIYAVHSYVDGVAPDYGSAEGWTALNQNIVNAFDKPLWMTETSDFNLQGFDLAFSMSKSLYLALKFGKISAWIYWAMNDAIIKNNELTKLGYGFKNFYRYIAPGSVMVDAMSNDNTVLALAFKDDAADNITIILVNNADVPKNITLSGITNTKPLTLFRTSSNENCLDLGVLTSNAITLPAHTINTVTSLSGSGVTPVEKKSPGQVDVYPNPASDQIMIVCTAAAERATVSVFDLSGRFIAQGKVNSNGYLDLDTSNWRKGTYLIKISDGVNLFVRKVIVK